jgi:hypothetical protein
MNKCSEWPFGMEYSVKLESRSNTFFCNTCMATCRIYMGQYHIGYVRVENQVKKSVLWAGGVA